MKKLTFILLFGLITFNLSAQADSVNISTTERLIDKYGGKIAESFNSLVEKATPVAEEGFKLAVRLQIAKGIVNLLPIVIAIIFSILLKKEYMRISTILSQKEIPYHMDRNNGPFDEDNQTIMLIGYTIGAFGFAILALFTTYSGITHLIAPEWYAIKDIIELFK